MPRYEYTAGTSNKFWEIERAGTTLTVRWGRIGAAGRNEKVYEHATAEAATTKYDKLVAEKTGKGYALVGKKAAKPKATKPKQAAWLANVKPTTQVKGKAGRVFDEDDSEEAVDPIDPAKVEKHLGLTLGPVMRDLIALCTAIKPRTIGDALAPLAPYHELVFESFWVAHKKIGYADSRPKSLRAFASDHKNTFYFYTVGTTTDDCPIAYEDVVSVEDPKLVAKDLVSWLSQLAFGDPPHHFDAFEKKEYKRIAANLRHVPGVSKALAGEALPDEVDAIDFADKPAKAWAAALSEAAAASESAGKPLTVGGATVSAKDLAAARTLHDKGGILASGSDAKKRGFLKEALALVGGATAGEAAELRLEVEKDLMSAYRYADKAKEAKELAERLLLDYAQRGITDDDAWGDLAMLVEEAKITVPAKQRAAVRRAWATAVLTEYVGDSKPKAKVPKDGKDAYNQARVELVHGKYAQALACLKVGKQHEHWGTHAETLEVEVLRQQGKLDAAKKLWKQIAERELDGTRYSHLDWTYMGALYVVLELAEPTLVKRMAKVWNDNAGTSSPSLLLL